MPNNSCSRYSTHAKSKQDPIRTGTGSNIELEWRSNKRIASISCHASLLAQLHLSSDEIDRSDYYEATISKGKQHGSKASPSAETMTIVHHGNDYVTVHIPQKVMSRHEIRDTLYGRGWILDMSRACGLDKHTSNHQVWSKQRN